MTEKPIFYCSSCDTDAVFGDAKDTFCAVCTLDSVRKNYVKVAANRNGSVETKPEDLAGSLGDLIRQMTKLLSPDRVKVVTVGDDAAYCWLLFFGKHIHGCLKATEPGIVTFKRLKELMDLYKVHLSQNKIALEISEATTFHVSEKGEFLRRPEEWMVVLTSPNFPFGNVDSATIGKTKAAKSTPTHPTKESTKKVVLREAMALVKREVAKQGPPVAKARVSRTTNAKTKIEKGVVTVAHTENVMTVPYANKFMLQEMMLTPAELPFLSTYAVMYEEYRFVSARFKFNTFAPTSTPGTIALAITYGNDKDETSMTEMKDHSGTVEGPVWAGEGDMISVAYLPSRASRKWYVTNPVSTNIPPAGNNAGQVIIGAADYSPAKVKCAVEGNPTDGSTLGYIEITYVCEFTGPRSPTQDENKDPSAISWSGVFGVVSKLIDVFGPLLLSILSVDKPIDQDVQDKAQLVKRLGNRGLLLAGMPYNDVVTVIDGAQKVLDMVAQQDTARELKAESDRIEAIVDAILAKKKEERLNNSQVGAGDGFCYLALFDESCHAEVKAKLGANPSWAQIIECTKTYSLSAKLLCAEQTGKDAWHVFEHKNGRLPHNLLEVVQDFGPVLLHCVGMPYRGYDSRATLAGAACWFDVTSISAVLQEATGLSFSVKANRDNIRKKFDGLKTAAPFSVSERFPENALYLYKGSGDWLGKFTRLYESLDTSAEVQNFAGGPRDARAAPTSYDDAYHSFYKTLEIMNMQLLNADGVFNRADFETEFGLEWQVATMADLVPTVAAICQPSEMRFNTQSIGAMNWPGLAHTALLDQVAPDLRVSTGSRVVLFSDSRVEGQRARTIMMLQNDGRLVGFMHDVIGTTD